MGWGLGVQANPAGGRQNCCVLKTSGAAGGGGGKQATPYSGPVASQAWRNQPGGEGEDSGGNRLKQHDYLLGDSGRRIAPWERSPHFPYPQAAPECAEQWAAQSGTSSCCGSQSAGQTSVLSEPSNYRRGCRFPAGRDSSSALFHPPQLTVLSISRSRYFSSGSRRVTRGRRDLRTK